MNPHNSERRGPRRRTKASRKLDQAEAEELPEELEQRLPKSLRVFRQLEQEAQARRKKR